ncbi:MAG: hypothetical protein Q7J47_20245 [Azoarcus sp.]|nr:hypothetical protein [Azoarcus sp.]
MTAPISRNPPLPPGELELLGFWGALLTGTVESTEFEDMVGRHWRGGRFLRQCMDAVDMAEEILHTQSDLSPAGYGHDIGDTRFESLLLSGSIGRPSAIHVRAPAERHAEGPLKTRNREPHVHDSGRIALITAEHATFFIEHPRRRGQAVLRVAVVRGDMLFWPAGLAHTFDAGNGFSLVSAMARHVPPASKEFALPAVSLGLDLDTCTSCDYAYYVDELASQVPEPLDV